jgi:hypothetical protein
MGDVRPAYVVPGEWLAYGIPGRDTKDRLTFSTSDRIWLADERSWRIDPSSFG